MKDKEFLPEKGFAQKTLELFPLYSSVIADYGWARLAILPNNFVEEWVREFYAEAAVTRGHIVRVRGTRVDYSPEAIGDHLQITPPPACRYNTIMKHKSDAMLDAILKTNAKPGCTWLITPSRNLHKFRRSELTPVASAWFYFIAHSILPTYRTTYLSLGRMTLIHCLIERHPVDISRLISYFIKDSLRVMKNKFIFPTLIHNILITSGVPTRPTDSTWCMESREISPECIDQVLSNPTPLQQIIGPLVRQIQDLRLENDQLRNELRVFEVNRSNKEFRHHQELTALINTARGENDQFKNEILAAIRQENDSSSSHDPME